MTAVPVDAQEFLRGVPPFGELPGRELKRVAAGTQRVRAPAGTVLFRRGNPCTGLHVIVYGQVKLALNGGDGAEKIVEIVYPGESFGEASLFLDEPHVVFAEALSNSLLLLVGKTALLEAIDRNPRFARGMLIRLAQRLRQLLLDVEGYTLKTSAQRVVAYLLRGVPPDAHARHDVELPVAKSVVASRLSITREHFSRVLRELVGAGLIEVSGHTIRVMDPARVRRRLSLRSLSNTGSACAPREGSDRTPCKSRAR